MKFLNNLTDTRPFLTLHHDEEINKVAIERILNADTGVGSLKELQDVIKGIRASNSIKEFTHRGNKEIWKKADAASMQLHQLNTQLTDKSKELQNQITLRRNQFSPTQDETQKEAEKQSEINTTQSKIAQCRYELQIIDQVSKIILEGLKGNKSIKQLDLTYSRLRDELRIELASVIEEYGRLTHLNLSHNELSDESGIAISKSFDSNQELQYLDLSHNKLTTDSLEALAAALQNTPLIEYLSLAHNQQHTQVDSSRHIASIIKQNAALRHLNMENMGLGAEGLKLIFTSIAGQNAIQFLNIANNGLADATEDIAAIIANQDSLLTHLILSNNPLTTEQLVILAKAVSNNNSLKSLELNRIGAAGEEAGAALALMLKDQASITHFSMADNNLDYLGAQLLAKSIATNHILQELIIAGNLLDEAGAIYIAKAIENGSRITKLDISHNNVQVAGLIYLSAAIEQNPDYLRVLNVGHNSITDDGIEALATVLTNIRSLDLSNNIITSNGTGFLAKGLATSPLQVLLLNNNTSIGAVGASSILEALEEGAHLNTLGIGGINLQDNGFESNASAFRDNICLRKLILDKNGLTSKSAPIIADLIKHNHFITSLSLEGNNFAADVPDQDAGVLKKLTGEDCIEEAIAESAVTSLKGLEDGYGRINEAIMSNIAKFGRRLAELDAEDSYYNSKELLKLLHQLQSKNEATSSEIGYLTDQEDSYYLEKISEHFARRKELKESPPSASKNMHELGMPTIESKCFDILDDTQFLGGALDYDAI